MEEPAYRQRYRQKIQTNHNILHETGQLAPHSQLEQLRDRLLGFLERESALLATRAAHVVEAYGDLRPEHICLTRLPVFIDCLEFNRPFRTEVTSEIDELRYRNLL